MGEDQRAGLAEAVKQFHRPEIIARKAEADLCEATVGCLGNGFDPLQAIALAVSAGLAGYLFYALIRGEKL